MATLTKQAVPAEGGTVTFAAAAATDQVAHEAGLLLVAWNDAGAASKNVTITSQGGSGVGIAPENTVVAVAVDAIAVVPIGHLVYKDANGFVQIACDVPTNMKYAFIKP